MTVPVRPDREEARSWALDELSRREYADARPGLVERIVDWVSARLRDIGGVGDTTSLALLGVVTTVVVAVVAWGVWRAGGIGRTARRHGLAVLDDPTATAADHRAAAERAAATGEWSEAVLHRFRAIARALEEEAVLSPQPGRTADEVAADAGGRLPPLAGELLAGARTFDDVRYGHRQVGEAAYQRIHALDDAVRATRPVPVEATPPDRLAVPS